MAVNNEPVDGRRTALIAKVSVNVLAFAFVGLLARSLWVEFPLSTSTGDARLQAWLGPIGARYAYVGISGLLAITVTGAALVGITPEAQRGWGVGIVGGLVSGLLLGAIYEFADATAQTVAQLMCRSFSPSRSDSASIMSMGT